MSISGNLAFYWLTSKKPISLHTHSN